MPLYSVTTFQWEGGFPVTPVWSFEPAGLMKIQNVSIRILGVEGRLTIVFEGPGVDVRLPSECFLRFLDGLDQVLGGFGWPGIVGRVTRQEEPGKLELYFRLNGEESERQRRAVMVSKLIALLQYCGAMPSQYFIPHIVTENFTAENLTGAKPLFEGEELFDRACAKVGYSASFI